MDQSKQTNALVCRRSRRFSRFSIGCFVSLLVLAQGVFFKEYFSASSPERTNNMVVLLVMSLLFGGLAALGIYQSLDRRPYLVIDAEGLSSPSLRITPVPWQYIREVRRTSDLFGHSFLEVVLHANCRPTEHMQRWKRLLPKLRRSSKEGVIHLIITSLDVPADQICQTIQKHLLTQGQ